MAHRTPTVGAQRPTDWRRMGGILGIAWVVIFLAGTFILVGEGPSRSDSVADIREYFTEDGDMYLAGQYLTGIAFMLFFLPFILILRRLLGSWGGLADLLARVSLFSGLVALIWGGLAATFWGGLALGADNPELDDSAVRALMEVDAHAYAGLLLPIGVFLGATGMAIWLTGLVWRWVGIIGLIGFVGSFIGAAWPIDGDDEGAVAAFGIAGFVGTVLFVLLLSIGLLVTRETEELPAGV